MNRNGEKESILILSILLCFLLCHLLTLGYKIIVSNMDLVKIKMNLSLILNFFPKKTDLSVIRNTVSLVVGLFYRQQIFG